MCWTTFNLCYAIIFYSIIRTRGTFRSPQLNIRHAILCEYIVDEICILSFYYDIRLICVTYWKISFQPSIVEWFSGIVREYILSDRISFLWFEIMWLNLYRNIDISDRFGLGLLTVYAHCTDVRRSLCIYYICKRYTKRWGPPSRKLIDSRIASNGRMLDGSGCPQSWTSYDQMGAIRGL